jgi:C-terminal processing protease CtpA/Prc
LDFEDRPLTDAEKRQRGLPPDGFASQVRYVAEFAKIRKTHELRVGDIIVGVDGAERDELANTAELFIKLRKNAGETVTLAVIRNGQRIQMPLKTYVLSFRK